MGLLIIKELNHRQVKWAEILIEYYFKIEYIKGINNIRIDILSKKVELQSSKKPLNAMLYIDKDRKIRYNYLQLIALYKVLVAD